MAPENPFDFRRHRTLADSPLSLTDLERQYWASGDKVAAEAFDMLAQAESYLDTEEDRRTAAFEDGRKDGQVDIRGPVLGVLDELKATAAELRKAARRCKAAQEWLDQLDAALIDMDKAAHG